MGVVEINGTSLFRKRPPLVLEEGFMGEFDQTDNGADSSLRNDKATPVTETCGSVNSEKFETLKEYHRTRYY